MTIEYIKSIDNIADPFTKGLVREQVNRSSRGMGLKPMNEKSPEWQSNLVDWRSEDLGSKGQPNCV